MSSLLSMHRRFDFVGCVRQVGVEVDELAIGTDEEVALDANAELLFGDVNARLDGEDHSRFQHGWVVGGIVHIDADHVAEAVQPVLAERLAMQVFAVSVDVVVGGGVERVWDRGGRGR